MTSLQHNSISITKYFQSGFQLAWDDKVIYVDPYKVPAEQPKASVIYITHEHPDHLDLGSISSLIDEHTVFAGPRSVEAVLSDAKLLNSRSFIILDPYGKGAEDETWHVWQEIDTHVVPAYNLDKQRPDGTMFHPQDNRWVGLMWRINDTVVYHMGDTDNIPELEELPDVDILLVPISGTYVMTPAEAAEAVAIINPSTYIVPMHHDAGVVGGNEALQEFTEALDNDPRLLVLDPLS